jgi:hypothetical protein
MGKATRLFDSEESLLEVEMRIPADPDQDSWMIPISIPD